MRHFINAQQYEIPTNPDGTISAKVVRKIGGIPTGRVLIMKRSDGSNEVINPDEERRIDPGQNFSDLPRTVRGN